MSYNLKNIQRTFQRIYGVRLHFVRFCFEFQTNRQDGLGAVSAVRHSQLLAGLAAQGVPLWYVDCLNQRPLWTRALEKLLPLPNHIEELE